MEQQLRERQDHLSQLPHRLHHYAVVIRDQEENRRFMEGILGIPLAATWCESVYNPDLKRNVDYCHTFYELGDGGALAFFQYADPADYERLKPNNLLIGQHIAFKVDRATQDEIAGRLDKAGLSYRRMNHGYCESIYLVSPDELRLEFTVDANDVDQIAAMRRADAHSELKRWLAGDHKVNNDIRHH